MKTKFRIIPVLLGLTLVFGIFSCENKTDNPVGKGKLEISLAMSGELASLKSAQADSVIINPDTTHFSSFQLLLSVEGVNGTLVFEDKLIPLYRFGNGFVSEQLEMNAGDFYLKKFMVLDNSGRVLFASPLEGSPRAYLVNQPLPLFFSVNPDQITQVAPEVLPVDGFTPADFGYATFLVQVVKPWPFYVMAMLDDPRMMRPSMLIDAELTVSTPDGWMHTFKLEPMLNKIEVRSSESYQLFVYKEGYEPVNLSISAKELLSTSEANPFILKIGTALYHTLILQPGPEDGMDARITNLEPDKNFGDYKYFEATFMSEPVLTVMRSTRSLIWFDLNQLPKSAWIKSVYLTLYYDIPVPWNDSVFASNGPWDSSSPWYGAALQQIVEPWKEYGVTWNNQPKTTEMGQVLIYPFVKNANFITLDVTKLYVPDPTLDFVAVPNYGMMLTLYPDEKFPGFRFASSDYPEPSMRPQLVVNYDLPVYGLD